MPQLDYNLLNNTDQEKGCIILFYDKAVKNNFKSREAQRPVYDDEVYVKIHAAGQSHSVVDRKMNEEHKTRYPTAWARYLAKDESIAGMPIEEWNGITRSQAAELKHIHVPTVEMLAVVTDENIANLGPNGMYLRDQAREFLAGQDEKDVELTELKEAVAALTAQVTDLQAAQAKPRKKPGPKPKVNADDASDDSTGHAERAA